MILKDDRNQASGFKMSMLSDITDVSLGNLIVIDSNFTYDGKAGAIGGEKELSEGPGNIKIGYNDSSNIRKFHFEQGYVPALIVPEGRSISTLESVTAIRRAVGKENKEKI